MAGECDLRVKVPDLSKDQSGETGSSCGERDVEPGSGSRLYHSDVIQRKTRTLNYKISVRTSSQIQIFPIIKFNGALKYQT